MNSKPNGDPLAEEKVQLANNNDDDEIEELPAIVKEGKDFRNELPDRLYLDSDPEFHLNLRIVLSYILLFHIDSHILMVKATFLFKTTLEILSHGPDSPIRAHSHTHTQQQQSVCLFLPLCLSLFVCHTVLGRFRL